MKQAFFVALAALAVLAGCAPGDDRCVALAGGATYCLQPTGAVAPFEVQQKVDLRFDGGRETLIADVAVDANAMHFVGLTPFGQKIVAATWDNARARADGPAAERLPPGLLLALVQLSRWPADALRAGLVEPLRLEESGDERRLLANGETVLTIVIDRTRVQYRRERFIIPAFQLLIDVEDLALVSE